MKELENFINNEQIKLIEVTRETRVETISQVESTEGVTPIFISFVQSNEETPSGSVLVETRDGKNGYYVNIATLSSSNLNIADPAIEVGLTTLLRKINFKEADAPNLIYIVTPITTSKKSAELIALSVQCILLREKIERKITEIFVETHGNNSDEKFLGLYSDNSSEKSDKKKKKKKNKKKK